MKKIVYFIICISAVLLLTGCKVAESKEKDKKAMFSLMEEQNIIGSNYKEKDNVYVCGGTSIGICECINYHVYEDDNSNMIAISYTRLSKSEEHDHRIRIYYDVTPNNSYRYYEESEEVDCNGVFYVDKDDREMDQNKYNFDEENEKEYYVTVERKLLSKKYKFEEINY